MLDHGEGLELPAYHSALASGADLRAAIAESAPLTLKPNQRALVPTGLILDIPETLEAQIRPRSGLAAKHGISVLNSPGTVDADYRGEIKVILINLGIEDFVVERGMRIAQIVFQPVVRAAFEQVSALTRTGRGADGFGSSGS